MFSVSIFDHHFQAFQNLMNLHILFCSAQKNDADGGVLPMASLALTLDDEVQYRCAGFIQAEIERYAEENDDGTAPGTGNASDSDSSNEDDPKAAKDQLKNGTKKGHHSERTDAKGEDFSLEFVVRVADSPSVPSTSRVKLEREYVFVEVISTFLRAIRSGVIYPSHGAVLLAHYGRLDATFDLCCKVVVDVLREEGMYHKNGDLVVTVVVQALQEVSGVAMIGGNLFR